MRKILGIALVMVTVFLASSCDSFTQLACNNEAGDWEKLLYDNETFLYYQHYEVSFGDEDAYIEGTGEDYSNYHNTLAEAIEEHGGIEGFQDYQKRELEKIGYSCKIGKANNGLTSAYKDFV